jgi:hypothetical protein
MHHTHSCRHHDRHRDRPHHRHRHPHRHPHHTATITVTVTITVTITLGWEFRFLVPIPGTPIRSGISIPFLIPEIPVGYFFEILMSGKSENWNFDWQNLEFRYFVCAGTQYVSLSPICIDSKACTMI